MKYLPTSEIKPTGVFLCSLHDQEKLDYATLVGYVNLYSVLHDTLYIPDNNLSTIPLVHWFDETHCKFLKEGIIKPLIRKTSPIYATGEIRQIKTFSDLYNEKTGVHHENNIFDGVITRFPPKAVGQLKEDKESAKRSGLRIGDKIDEDIYSEIDDNAIAIASESPDVQSDYESE